MVNGQIVNGEWAMVNGLANFKPTFRIPNSSISPASMPLCLVASLPSFYIAGHTKGTRFAFTALLPMIDNDNSKLFDLPLIFDRSLVPTS
jgi:hypothetical protein